MQYFVAKASSLLKLETAVNNLLNDGWKPQGGLVVSEDDLGMNLEFYQAMYKE